MDYIPYGTQDIQPEDIEAVVRVLKSDWLTQGPTIAEFEGALASVSDCRHAVAVNSGTSALHIACAALGLGPGDWLWTSPNTFAASANCALYCGANVDFVDIDPQTYNMSVGRLAAKLEQAATTGRLPKIVVTVHFGGQSCDMAGIRALAEKYRFFVVEDASHAVGARYKNEPVGNCRYSDISVFSFHPVKIITTAEGGAALTNNADLAERMARLRTHGITRDSAAMEGETEGPWYYQMLELGLNYRMTDLQAALGLSQLSRLERYVTRRRELASRYDTLLAELPVTRPWQSSETSSSWHLYVVQVNADARRRIFERMRAAGIGVNVHYIPVHLQPFYKRLGFGEGDFPEAERYYARALTLPLFPRLTELQQDRVVEALRSSLN